MTGAARFGKLPASNSGSTMSAKSVLRWVLPAIALLVGFADLWRGGMTLAPLVLILGYCVFIPWAIWSKPGTEEAITDPAAYRPSYAYAGIASLVVLGLYVATLAPTTAMWDTSEYIAAAYTLGFPHPPGNPFFVLIGRFFAVLPIAPNVAMRVNILAALSSAGAAGMWFLITERVLVGWLPERWQRIVGGSIAALIGATAFTVWAQSVVNEKVYTVSLLGLALVSWLTVRWCDESYGFKADRLLVMIAYLSGLGYANHMAGFLALPAVAVAVPLRRLDTLLRWRLLLAFAGALALGMTPFLTQPLRTAHFPALEQGEPIGRDTSLGLGWSL